MRSTTRAMVHKARTLRRAMTKPEAALWQVLRTRPAGLKFRRQHPVGPYVLDFYCPMAKLGVEVDGMAHEMGNRPERDERRDIWLVEQGLSVLRIPATEVLTNIEGVVALLADTCLSSPSRSDGEGERAGEARPGDVPTAQPDAQHRLAKGDGGANGSQSPSTALRAVPLPTAAPQGGQ